MLESLSHCQEGCRLKKSEHKATGLKEDLCHCFRATYEEKKKKEMKTKRIMISFLPLILKLITCVLTVEGFGPLGTKLSHFAFA